MTDWSSGYVTEIGYTFGYYRELDPKLPALAALLRGINAPGLGSEPIRVLELGCGQGLSANILSAANPSVSYTACDFNPAHIAGALDLAQAAGTRNVHLTETSFADVASDTSLGLFDLITLHGIYTWVSAENREHIIRIAREKLRPGGMLYLSYNTHPGWASFLPLRRVFRDVAADRPALPMLQRLDEGFRLLDRVADAGARYINQVPGLLDRVRRSSKLDRHYLAHEYLNDEWTIFHFADVAADMARAKLSYVASVNLLDHIDQINLTPDQQAILAEFPDPVRREGLRDLIVNQQFRRDIFIKGAVPLGAGQGKQRWLDLRVALTMRAADVPNKVAGSLGEVSLQPESYDPVIAALAGGPRTVSELLADPAVAAIGGQRLQQVLTILIGAGWAQPAAPAKGEGERVRHADALNKVILERALNSAELAYLASPVLGSGLMVDRFAQLTLLAARQSPAAEPVAFIWNALKAHGQRVVKDGVTLEGEAENLAEIGERVARIREKQLPILSQLKIR